MDEVLSTQAAAASCTTRDDVDWHGETVKKSFLDHFPPPRFLEMPAFGFDIADEAIRIAHIRKKTGGRFHLETFGTIPLPDGLIVGGDIADVPALTTIVTDIKEKFGIEYVKASVPEQKSYLFKTELPFMSDQDIRNAIRFKIEENVPVALNDAVFDYHYIHPPHRNPAAPNEKMQIGVAVADARIINQYLEVFQNAGITPLKFRTQSQGVAHAVIRPTDPETFIVITFKKKETVFSIVSQHVVQYSSTLAISGEIIARSIEGYAHPSAPRDEGVFMSLMSSAAMLKDEILKIEAFWKKLGDPAYPHIRKILLCGAYALRGIDTYLASSTSMPVRIADVWTNILSVEDEVPPLPMSESLDYATALGLALPYY
jgi:Tfp pilus assembly PilM family ATPase